jgi:hypothetical protein
MQPLNLVVISTNGLAYTEQFKEAADQKTFSFDLEIIPEMAPEANVVIFYVRDQDGLVVHDQFHIKLGFVSTNFVSFFFKRLTFLINFQIF